MSITHDVSGSGSVAGTSLTVPVTTNAITEALACASVPFRAGSITSVVFDGTTLTHDGQTDNSPMSCGIYYKALGSIGSGSKNMVITGSSNSAISCGVVVLAGVNQSTPFDARQTATGLASPFTLSITTTEDGCAIVDGVSSRANVAVVMSAQTNRTQVGAEVPGANARGSMSRLVNKTTAGAQTMDYTGGSGDEWAMRAIAFKPAPAGGATTPLSLFQRVA